MGKYDVVTTTRKVNIDNQSPAQNQDNQTMTTVEYKHVTYDRHLDWCDYLQLSLFAIIIIAGIIGFIKAIKSRKFYKCPVCGESFRAENMSPSNCKICGAELNETDDPNITDKTK